MKKIKYIWNLENPSQPKKWQMLLFCLAFCAGCFYYFPITGALVASVSVFGILYFNPQFISQILFRLTYTVHAVIHFINLVFLSFIFYTLMTPMAFIAKIFKKNFLIVDFKENRESYFVAGDQMDQDHFLRPY